MTDKSKTGKKSAVARRIRARNRTLAIATVIILVVVCLFTPLFDITEIYVTGNSILKTEDIIAASGIKKGDNLFRLNTEKAEKAVNALGYVQSVSVNRKFFAKVEIKVTESEETAYIAFSGNYIGINSDAKVLSIRRSGKFNPKKAVVSGMAVNSVRKGEYIEAKKPEKLELTKQLISELAKANILDSITKINISDINEISLTMNTETVIILGSSQQLDYKVKYIQAVLEKLGDIRGGKINASDPANVIYEGGN